MTRCPRCGDRFTRQSINQTHCLPCAIEVAAIVEADAKRRAPRFTSPKDMTYGRAA